MAEPKPDSGLEAKQILMGGKWKWAYVNKDKVAVAWADTLDDLQSKYGSKYGGSAWKAKGTPLKRTAEPWADKTPIDTDSSIEKGVANAGFNPAHDVDAPLGPGYDYTPKWSPPAPTISAPIAPTPTPSAPAPVSKPKKASKKKYQYYWNDPEWKKKHSYGGSGEWLYGEAPAFGSPGYDGPLEPWKERPAKTAPRPSAPRRSTRRF